MMLTISPVNNSQGLLLPANSCVNRFQLNGFFLGGGQQRIELENELKTQGHFCLCVINSPEGQSTVMCYRQGFVEKLDEWWVIKQ